MLACSSVHLDVVSECRRFTSGACAAVSDEDASGHRGLRRNLRLEKQHHNASACGILTRLGRLTYFELL